jgi:AmmeMemoRadiSam system protein A
MRPIVTPEAPPAPSGSTTSPVVSAEVRRSLLDLARVALAVATGRDRPVALDRALARSQGGVTRGGVFVTLTEHEALRGCVGNLEGGVQLGVAVVTAALSAALDDPRFMPVTVGELPAIRIDISVLGSAQPLSDPGAFRPGIDGIIVERGGRRGLLLPEVATEYGWGATQMFEAACRKAGLTADAWREPGTRLHTFRSFRFGGPAVATH